MGWLAASVAAGVFIAVLNFNGYNLRRSWLEAMIYVVGATGAAMVGAILYRSLI